ncbi:MAG: YlbF family regulator [Verrucomicrobiia bacterium]|jgi:cell fate (sporulation/competence/biofilm development) regulator YlbF (YheA/YmcA/DUF963 family)
MENQDQTPKENFEAKILDLCGAIAGHAQFNDLCGSINNFMSDEKLKYEYQMLNEMGEILQQKQQMGGEISPEEIARFESVRDSFTGNDIAMKFVNAQETVTKMQDHILRHVQKTFEVGRKPTADEMMDGMCCDCTCGFEEPAEGEVADEVADEVNPAAN